MDAADTANTPISKALARRKELQELIASYMKELERIEEFISMYKKLTAGDDNKGDEVQAAPRLLASAGYGNTQSVFLQLVRTVLREVGRPMQSGEIVAELRKRGYELGGNETRTAWNRLWMAKKAGELQNIERYGYWLADEPIPPLPLFPPKGPPLKRSRGREGKIGRKPVLTPAQVEVAKTMLLAGKTYDQIAQEFGGIHAQTLRNYLGRKRDLVKKATEEREKPET